MNKLFWASLLVVLISTIAPMASIKTSITTPLDNIVSNELIIRGTDGTNVLQEITNAEILSSAKAGKCG